MKVSGWSRTEGKDREGYRWFRWTSALNDDVFIEVRRASVRVDRLGPVQVNVTYLTPGTPGFQKNLGYYVFLHRFGDSLSMLGGTVRQYDSVTGGYWFKDSKGPFTQEDARGIALAYLENEEFLRRNVIPKRYEVDFVGWSRERRPRGFLYVNENDGRHQILVLGVDREYLIRHTFGYGGENPRVLFEKRVVGRTNAFRELARYIGRLGSLPKGELERGLKGLFDTVGPLVRDAKPEALDRVRRLLKSGAISPKQSVKLLEMNRKDD